jgi:copper chaperone CopZ
MLLILTNVHGCKNNYSTSVGGYTDTSETESTSSSEVKLTDGTRMTLTGEETALKASHGQRKVVLTDLGMTCSNCKYAVTAGLDGEKGIVDFYVNLPDDRATVIFDPDKVNLETIKQSIANVGYQVGEVKEVQ